MNIQQLRIYISTDNDFANALISSKEIITRDKDIELIKNSTKNIVKINDVDLCSIVGNLLDNAIEATEKVAKTSK